MNRSAFRTTLSVFITVAFVGWCVWYFLQRRDELRMLLEVPLSSLLFLYVAAAVHLGLAALFTREVSHAGGQTTRAWFYLAVATLSALVNMTLPGKTGAGFRAAYLWRVCGVGLLFFGAALIAYNLVYVAIHAAIGLATLPMLYLERQDVPQLIPTLVVIAFVTSIAALWFPWARIIPERWRSHSETLAAATKILQQRRFIVASAGVALAAYSLTALQYAVAFSAIGVELSVLHILIFVAARNASGLIGLTPGAIGVVEAVAIALGGMMGYTTMDALLVQTIMRGVSMSLTLVAGPFALMALRSLPKDDALEDETVGDVEPEVGVDE